LTSAESPDPISSIEAPPPGAQARQLPVDPDYGNRRGYARDFVGFRIPLPRLSATQGHDVAPQLSGGGNVLRYEHFSLALSRSRRVAIFTAVNIDGHKVVDLGPRGDDVWIFDPRVDEALQLPSSFYDGNAFDRGHLVRRLDPVWGDDQAEAEKAEADTFHLTNSAPQHMTFNRSKRRWQGIENYILGNADLHHLRIAVFSGPVFRPDDPVVNDVQVPVDFWKVVAMQKSDQKPAAAAYLLTQRDLVEAMPPTRAPAEFVFGEYRTFQVPMTDVETRTQLGFGRLRDHDTLKRVRGAPAYVELETLDDMIV